jgi:diguanylate cyclase
VIADLQGYEDFHSASQAVIAHLRERFDFDLWMVTRAQGEDWIILEATENRYGVEAGQVLRWGDSFCSRMVQGAPRVAPRASEVVAYREAPIGQQLAIGSYVGVPLTDGRGELFGTLCAIDPDTQSDELLKQQPTVQLLARLLGTILAQDLAAAERGRRLEIAEADALTDALTGLPNRRAWDRFLDQEEARCQRFGHPATVLVIDLDGLKRVNDGTGHAAGDELLRTMGTTLRAVCRSSDLAARLGGDEFGVIATESDADEGFVLRDRLMAALADAGVGASIGVAARRHDGTLHQAAQVADSEMYRVKRGPQD